MSSTSSTTISLTWLLLEFLICRITDEWYTRFVVSKGRRFRDSLEIIALKKKTYEMHCEMFLEASNLCDDAI
ncbi:hypothetical protein Lalb_Chr09g0334491 [Lupinus albus]|uniref:Uncharacterized protein n=1 Tax=Lupinus albus TaxID=3870 RepID=A0A6A4Q1Z7_LUPAL|nr:hypothetical protein Lalb_Chr09g0334491 [Lupinus albus]